MKKHKTYSLWWGESGLHLNCPSLQLFLEDLATRQFNLQAKFIHRPKRDVEYIRRVIQCQPCGILLIGTTPAFVSYYGHRVPARGYQIIWKEVQS